MKSYNERVEATREKIKAYKTKAKARRKAIILSTVSLCTCLLIVLNIVLFLPPTKYPGVNPGLGNIIHGAQNEDYSEVIDALGTIRNGGGGDDWADDGAASAPGEGNAGGTGSSGGEQYVETTDNQVAGVIEGDLIKRTNKYIYYLPLKYYYINPYTSALNLCVYPIDGVQKECIAEFPITPQADYRYNTNGEMYLSQNGDTVTVILSEYRSVQISEKYHTILNYTEVVNIDVSDLSDIKITDRYYVSGSYVSSRLVNGELLLVTNFMVSYKVDFDDVEQFIPSTGVVDNMTLIPAKNIHCPEKPMDARFTVVCSLDAATLKETGREAFLSYSTNVYVSANNIYLTNSYTSYNDLLSYTTDDILNNDYHVVYEKKTEISRVEYGGELEYKGSFTVLGSVLNRFSMDEKDGVLRVVTTPHRYEYGRENNRYHSIIADGASLYCVDIETYEVVGKLENFAPEEDTVQSVRFDGDKVYVCTAVVMTDPVFAIDISDYNNIHSVDTGEIPGYSIALRKFYGDTLLGIGYGSTGWSNRDLKIELYKETENSVESAATFTYIDEGYEYDGQYYKYANVYFSADYKAYFIDAERGLIGLGLTIEAFDDTNGFISVQTGRYILLQYDGESLKPVLDLDIGIYTGYGYYFYSLVRAVYVDGAFYVFTPNGLTVTELDI